MELKWVWGFLTSYLLMAWGQDTYQASTYIDYDQGFASGTQDFQYSPSGANYPISSRQGNGLLPLGIAAAIGVGAAAVGVALALQAADARNTLANNVMSATASATNLNDILTAQSPVLNSLVTAQAPIDARLTSLCTAAATIGAIPTIENGDLLGVTGPVITTILTALGSVNCV